jgi:hypothetical protein
MSHSAPQMDPVPAPSAVPCPAGAGDQQSGPAASPGIGVPVSVWGGRSAPGPGTGSWPGSRACHHGVLQAGRAGRHPCRWDRGVPDRSCRGGPPGPGSVREPGCLPRGERTPGPAPRPGGVLAVLTPAPTVRPGCAMTRLGSSPPPAPPGWSTPSTSAPCTPPSPAASSSPGPPGARPDEAVGSPAAHARIHSDLLVFTKPEKPASSAELKGSQPEPEGPMR